MPNSSFPLIQNFDARAVVVTAATHGRSDVSQTQWLAFVAELTEQLQGVSFLFNLCADRYHFLCGFSAALAAGVSSVLPPNIQDDTLKEMTERYPDSCFLIDDDRFFGLPEYIDIRAAVGAAHTLPATTAPPVCRGDHVAAIAFTSGSTGKPQAHTKPLKTLAGTAILLGERFAVDCNGERPHVVATVPSQHMYGLEMTVMMALQAGWVMHAAHPFFPQDIVHALQHIPEPRVLVTTPVHLRALVGAKLELPPIALIVSATAPLSQALAAAAEAKFNAPVKEIYGCTEAGSLATRRTTAGDTWETLSGMSLVDDENGIAIIGDHLEGPVPLGDMLERVSPTHFHLLGRASDMLNVGGKRASLKDLNELLLAIDGVDDGIIFVPDKKEGTEPRPAALVVSQTLSENDILAVLARRVDPVFLPRPCRKVAALPRNKVGKLPAHALSALLKGAQSS